MVVSGQEQQSVKRVGSGYVSLVPDIPGGPPQSKGRTMLTNHTTPLPLQVEADDFYEVESTFQIVLYLPVSGALRATGSFKQAQL